MLYIVNTLRTCSRTGQHTLVQHATLRLRCAQRPALLVEALAHGEVWGPSALVQEVPHLSAAEPLNVVLVNARCFLLQTPASKIWFLRLEHTQSVPGFNITTGLNSGSIYVPYAHGSPAIRNCMKTLPPLRDFP